MHVISFPQPYAQLIITGCLQYMFRRYKPAKISWDATIGIHAAKARVYNSELVHFMGALGRYGPEACGIRPKKHDAALSLVSRFMKDRSILPTSALLGTAKLRMPIRVKEIVIEGNAGAIDESLWAWPFVNARKWREPVPIIGSCGVWTYDQAA